MLLEADTCICRGVYVTDFSASRNPWGVDDSLAHAEFPSDGLATEEWPPPPPQEMWLVGLETRDTDRPPVWRYYVVDHAHSSCQASLAALRRADSAPERAAWGEADGVDRVESVEVQRILRDVLGNVTLAPRS